MGYIIAYTLGSSAILYSEEIETRNYAEAARNFLEEHPEVSEDNIEFIQEQLDDCRVTKWHPAGTLYYLNGWTVTREYGGHEEGGWYYNAGVPVAVIPVNVVCKPTELPEDVLGEQIEGLKKLLEDNFKHGDIYSVLGGEDVEVRVQSEFGRAFPEHRPIYE